MTMASATDSDGPNIEFLRQAFKLEQDRLLASLRCSDRIVHKGDRGEVNERIFIDFLQSYLPNRYTVDKAMVLDSNGAVSDSIDVVVFDRQYTPILLDSAQHRYVPAEAVYAIFECKPTVNKTYLKYAGEKAASVRQLKRTSIPIPHAGGTYPARPLFDIVAGILAIDVEWTDNFGASFKKNHTALVGDERLDCGFAAAGAAFDTFDEGVHTICDGDNALARFAFRLLSKLQSLATVPAVDWMAYAQRFADEEGT